jgi:putative ATP-dependent endonuclease of OLD family
VTLIPCLLQQPILDRLSNGIKTTLQQFLPQVKSVSFKIATEKRFEALRSSAEIHVNDGASTLLRYKGDGAQSLAALAIIRHSSERGASGKNLVTAIEEPESHLHPSAIHELRDVVEDLSNEHQIILTTHNPLFADRRVIANNIIVRNNKAKCCESIDEIRETLGVRASDNLRNAELVLIVEGENDRASLRAILCHLKPFLADSLSHNTVAIESLAGASNLTYKLTQIRSAICLYHVFLDYDKAGIDAFEKAKSQGLLDDADINFARFAGQKESELEDFYDTRLCEPLILAKYRVSINSPKFKSQKKWSERVRDCFSQQGKLWSESTEKEIKAFLASAVAADPSAALKRDQTDPLIALAETLERRLKDRERAQSDSLARMSAASE